MRNHTTKLEVDGNLSRKKVKIYFINLIKEKDQNTRKTKHKRKHCWRIFLFKTKHDFFSTKTFVWWLRLRKSTNFEVHGERIEGSKKKKRFIKNNNTTNKTEKTRETINQESKVWKFLCWMLYIVFWCVMVIKMLLVRGRDEQEKKSKKQR